MTYRQQARQIFDSNPIVASLTIRKRQPKVRSSRSKKRVAEKATGGSKPISAAVHSQRPVPCRWQVTNGGIICQVGAVLSTVRRILRWRPPAAGCGQILWSARAPIVVQPFQAALCRLESLHHNCSVAHKIWPHPGGPVGRSDSST